MAGFHAARRHWRQRCSFHQPPQRAFPTDDAEALIQRCIDDGLAIRHVHLMVESLRNLKNIRAEAGLTPEETATLEALEDEFEKRSLVYIALQQRLANGGSGVIF